MIIQVVEKLVARLEAMKGSNTVIRLDHAFSALSGDIVGKVCCEDKEDFLDDPKFALWWYTALSQPFRFPRRSLGSRYDLFHIITTSIPLLTGFPLLIQ